MAANATWACKIEETTTAKMALDNGELFGSAFTKIIGDNYAAEFSVNEFQEHGIGYTASEKNRSELYLDLLPLINSGRVEFLDNERLISQLCALERRTSKSGRDSINHPETGGSGAHHDDVINSAAGALVNVALRPARIMTAQYLEALTAAVRHPSKRGRSLTGSQRIAI